MTVSVFKWIAKVDSGLPHKLPVKECANIHESMK